MSLAGRSQAAAARLEAQLIEAQQLNAELTGSTSTLLAGVEQAEAAGTEERANATRAEQSLKGQLLEKLEASEVAASTAVLLTELLNRRVLFFESPWAESPSIEWL